MRPGDFTRVQRDRPSHAHRPAADHQPIVQVQVLSTVLQYSCIYLQLQGGEHERESRFTKNMVISAPQSPPPVFGAVEE